MAGPTTGTTSGAIWVADRQRTFSTRCGPMSVGRTGCSGCVLSDDRFAVLGGYSYGLCMSSCEALTLGGDEHWSLLPPMHDLRMSRGSSVQSEKADWNRRFLVLKSETQELLVILSIFLHARLFSSRMCHRRRRRRVSSMQVSRSLRRGARSVAAAST